MPEPPCGARVHYLETIMTKVLAGILVTVIVCALFAFSTWLLMFLWNAVVAESFGLPELTFWRAAGFGALLSVIGWFVRK